LTAPGIPNEYTLSTTCFGARLGSIQDQIFAAVGMGFRRIELGLSEAPPTMDGLDDSRGDGHGHPLPGRRCRDALNGSTMAATQLGSLIPDERERAINSVRRHVRLAQSWGCGTVVIRGSRIADERMRKRARSTRSAPSKRAPRPS
jgi:hypothetical protein